MMRLLAAVGRFVTAASALLIIVVGAVLGWVSVDYYPVGDLGVNLYPTQNTRNLLTVIGAFGGLLVAGTFYGLFAAIYDTHRMMRRLVAVSERCEILLRSRNAG